jgi:hypothetical protein
LDTLLDNLTDDVKIVVFERLKAWINHAADAPLAIQIFSSLEV